MKDMGNNVLLVEIIQSSSLERMSGCCSYRVVIRAGVVTDKCFVRNGSFIVDAIVEGHQSKKETCVWRHRHEGFPCGRRVLWNGLHGGGIDELQRKVALDHHGCDLVFSSSTVANGLSLFENSFNLVVLWFCL